MKDFLNTHDIVREMNKKVLKGAKIPHSCSFPVLRIDGGKYVLAVFVQLINKEQLEKQVMQRPAYWCCADIFDGSEFAEFNCKEKEFCTAPYNRLYNKGIAEKVGTSQDVMDLYAMMDDIRMKYTESGLLDGFAYKQYLSNLFKIIPKGQINFYKELSNFNHENLGA